MSAGICVRGTHRPRIFCPTGQIHLGISVRPDRKSCPSLGKCVRYLIVHSLVTLETKFYVNDVIIASIACIKLAQVKHQLLPTAINSRPPVHFVIPIIAQFQYFLNQAHAWFLEITFVPPKCVCVCVCVCVSTPEASLVNQTTFLGIALID